LNTLKTTFSEIEKLFAKFKQGVNLNDADPELLENLAEEVRLLRQ
jgi:hypothetical protein